jgi:hypothetical protein
MRTPYASVSINPDGWATIATVAPNNVTDRPFVLPDRSSTIK